MIVEHTSAPAAWGLEPPQASGAQLSGPLDSSALGCETSKGKGGGHQLRLTGAGAICWPGGDQPHLLLVAMSRLALSGRRPWLCPSQERQASTPFVHSSSHRYLPSVCPKRSSFSWHKPLNYSECLKRGSPGCPGGATNHLTQALALEQASLREG